MSGLGNNPTKTVPRLLSNLEVAVGIVFVIFGAISFVGYLHPRIPVSGITQDGGLWLLLDALLLPIGASVLAAGIILRNASRYIWAGQLLILFCMVCHLYTSPSPRH
jgi:hypothetical protein